MSLGLSRIAFYGGPVYARPARRWVIAIPSPLIEARNEADPEVIGQFRVLARLGRGGFGVVYAARADEPDGELAALKVAHGQHADSDHFRARFAREIESIKRVNSDLVPRFIAGSASGDRLWLATELIPGPSLDKVVKRCGPLPLAAAWRLGAGMAAGLAAIHAAGLVHRDLKPQNVLLVPDRPWIIDFGLVHQSELPHDSSSRVPIATPEYAPPEQLLELSAAGRPADIFALGATLLFAVTGHPPRAVGPQEDLRSLPNLAGLPAGPLRELVLRCLSTSPRNRPALAEVSRELVRHSEDARRTGFEANLPRKVVTMLDDFREELARVLGTYGPARLGWTRVGPEWDAWVGDAGNLPAVEDLGPEPAPPVSWAMEDSRGPRRTRILEPTGPVGPIGEADTGSSDRAPAMREFRTAVARGRGQDRRPSAEPVTPYQDPFADLRRAPDRENRGNRVIGGAVWRREFGGWIHEPVAVHQDICVVVCLDGTVSGLRAHDGRDLWRPVQLPAPVTGTPVILPRGMGFDGAVFAAARDGSVHAIDLRHGDRQQILPAGPAVAGSPVVVRNDATLQNVVYVARADGGIYAIDLPRRKPRALCHLAYGASGAMAADSAVVAVADTRGTVYMVDAQTGEAVPRLSAGGQVLGSPVLAGGRVFAAATDGTLTVAGISLGVEDIVQLGAASVHAAPVYHAGRLYVGASDGRVHAYDVAGHGSSVLTRSWPPAELGTEIAGLAVGPSGTIYAAAGYRVVSIDHRDGRPSGTVRELNCLVGAAPVISGDFCYVVGLGGVAEKVSLR